MAREKHIFAAAWLGGLLTLSACGPYPADVVGVTNDVARRGEVRVGLVAGESDAREATMRSLADKIAQARHARLASQEGSAREMIDGLEHGRLDAVVGVFPKTSPWSKHAALSAPYPKRDVEKSEPVVRAAVRKGENRWLLIVEKVIAGAKDDA